MGYDEFSEINADACSDPRFQIVLNLIQGVVAATLPAFIFAPCAVGKHVDHQIVRMAADAIGEVHVLYYEDVPYSSQLSLCDLERTLVAEKMAPAMTVSIDGVIDSKCDAMWNYSSQTNQCVIAKMLLHAARVGGEEVQYAERVWRRIN